MTISKQTTKHEAKRKSGLATASFILGIVSFIPGLSFFTSVIGLILGFIALRDIKRDQLGGRKLAIWGIGLSIGGLVATILLYAGMFFFMFTQGSGPMAEARVEASKQILTQNAGAIELYKKEYGKYPASLDEITNEKYTVFPVDHFMNPIFYSVSSDGQAYQLKSTGPDGTINTSDDISLD